jgi:sporulation protein YlmC with PRC-barrel domain
MSKEDSRYIATQRFAGMQVIDSRGTVVGNVKDVSVDFKNKALAFRVTTRKHSELDMTWEDVQSVEDVVLLKKEVDLTSIPDAHSSTPNNEPPITIQAVMICPSCGASAPGNAKFCPKCGTTLR